MANQNIPAIQQKAGNVGIGTSDPGSYKLNVNGESAFQDHVTVNSAKYIYTNNIGANSTSTNLVIAGPSSAHTVFTVANVGIGTTSPTSKLEVYGGDAKISNNYALGWRYSDANSSMYNYIYSSYDDTTVGITYRSGGWTSGTTITSHNFQTYISSTWVSRLVILQNGNVGIGSTTPGYKLDVNGEVAFSPNTAGKNTFIFTTNASNDGRLLIKSDTTNKVDIQANGATYFNGGNVGIGTTSPSGRLHIAVDGAAVWSQYFTATNGANKRNSIGFHDSGNTNIAAILTDVNADGTADFGISVPNGSPRLVIKASGNVGIGTTSPATLLNIEGNDADAIQFRIKNNSITNGNKYLAMFVAGTTGYSVSGWANSSVIESAGGTNSNFVLGNYEDGPIIFQTNNRSEKVRIASNGNVGIGTTAPTQKLEVNGSTWVGGTVYINRGVNSTEGYIYFDHPGTQVWKQGIFNDNTSTFSIGNAGGFTRLLNITNGGNVGIGTTSPSQKLEVYAGSDATSNLVLWGQTIRNEGNAATTGYGTGLKFKISGDSVPNELYKWAGIAAVAGTNYSNRTDLAFYTNAASTAHATEKVRITGDGSIGIGTTDPLYTLHVVGNINTTGDIYFNSTSTLRTARRYVSTAVVSNAGYTVVCNVTGDVLASGVRMTFQGTADNTVINVAADILVNHFQDILITSQTGIYTIVTLRVKSNNNDIFSIEATTNSPASCTMNVEVYPLNSETVSFGGSAQTGASLTHTCRPGINISATGGSDGDFAASGYGYFGGNLGIGAYSPGNKLLISSAVGAAGFDNGISIVTSPGTYTTGHGGMIQFQNEDVITAGIRGVRESGWGSGMAFYVHNSSAGNTFNSTFVERMRINESGYVGIGTTAPAYALDVSGTIRATADIIAYSDARVKENVNTITDALTKVISLRGVSYTRNDSEDKSEKVGVIAQEVLPILPEVVQQDTNGNYSVAYGNMVGVLIEAIKEQQRQIDELKYLLQNK